MSAIVDYQAKTNMENKMSERMKRINNMKRQERRTKFILILVLLVGYLIIIEHMVSLALD